MKTSNTLINQVLTAAEPFLNQLIDKREAAAIKAGESFTAYDRKMTRLALTIDLVKAAGNYLLNSDELVGKFELNTGRAGVIEIHAVIKRNEQLYHFDTQMILAGGYNVQCLHYRYIVRTLLPKILLNIPLKELKDEEKAMKAEQKLLQEIKYQEAYITREENKLAKLEAKDIAEIEKFSKSLWGEYDSLNEIAKDRYTPETYAIRVQQDVERRTNDHYSDIRVTKHYIKEGKKKLEKLQAKLAALAE